MYQRGFTLIEAVVAIALFSILFIGATLLLSTYETQNSQLRSLTNRQSLSYSFLQEWGNVSRRLDRRADGARPVASVLDDLDGVNFKSESVPMLSNSTISKLFADWRERLIAEASNVDSWTLSVSTSSEHYRTLTLTVDGQQTQYFICCATTP